MQKTKSNSVCLLIIAVIILLLTAQSFFSFNQTDESNYAAFVYRIYSGDALFRDEWHPTQLYSPLLFPFYLIFRIFSHDNTGIILYYRILYTFFSGAAAVFLYKRLDPLYRSMPALCAALFCLLYSRANINGCSYYKLSFLLVLISAVLLREKNKKSIQCPKAHFTHIFILGIISFVVFDSFAENHKGIEYQNRQWCKIKCLSNQTGATIMGK